MELKLHTHRKVRICSGLLIVPYGIETAERFPLVREQTLLIVPYGIETRVEKITNCETDPFNRTLWN